MSPLYRYEIRPHAGYLGGLPLKRIYAHNHQLAAERYALLVGWSVEPGTGPPRRTVAVYGRDQDQPKRIAAKFFGLVRP